MLVMLAVPSVALVEPDSIFSIDGTKWDFCAIGLQTLPPFVLPIFFTWGFYQGKVYNCFGSDCSLDYSMGYIDTPVVSIIYSFNYPATWAGMGFGWGVVQPSGIGIFTEFTYFVVKSGYPMFISFIGIMFKTDDSWTPPTTTTTI
jgi:hypothetical protein